jgi:MFS transporter, MHS family, shikimate and dehydroshikimate transport protein
MERLGGAREGRRTSVTEASMASVVGTVIEWYDFFIYGAAAAIVFNQLFFPEFAPLTGTMAAFGTYALGFFARSSGGIVFGNYGDKIGRKAMLVLTLMLMGVATTFMGLLPTFDQVGYLAPVLLLLLRILQGLGAGAEFGAARWSWRQSILPRDAAASTRACRVRASRWGSCSRRGSSPCSRRCRRSSSWPGVGAYLSC